MSNAMKSFGTLLQVGDGSTPESFATVAEVRDITPIGVNSDTEEVTHMSSPGGYKEYLPTLLDAGEVSFEVNWDPVAATHGYATGLLKDAEDQVLRNFQLLLPDPATTTWAFSAYVTAVKPKTTVGGVLRSDITLRPTGQPTLA